MNKPKASTQHNPEVGEEISVSARAGWIDRKKMNRAAENIELPEDLPAFFDQVHKEADSLPEIFSGFEFGLKQHLSYAQDAYKREDETSLRQYLFMLYQNLTRLRGNLEIYHAEQGHKSGAGKTNAKYDQAKDFARQEARELVEGDTLKEYTKPDIIKWVTGSLHQTGGYTPSARILWDWLKESPSVIPDYMTKPGRPRKENAEN